MKIYIQHKPDAPLYLVRIEDITDSLEPEVFCDVDKHSYELSMDSSHTVTLDYAPFSVDSSEFARQLEQSILYALYDYYGRDTFTDNDQNQ